MLRRPLTGTALLYLALLGSKQAQASQDLAGDYIHIYYGDLGLWFDEAASAGFQANLDGSWADFVATGTADPYVFAGVQYTKSSTTYDFYAGFDTDFFADADWTVTSEEDLSDSDRLWSRYEWEIGDVTVVKDEKWEPAERTMLVTFTVTNNATTDLDTFQLVDIVDADDPSGSSTMTCDTRDQDGDGVKDWAESRGRTSNYTIGFGLCNPNAQEVGHDSYPADFSELEITDFAAARGDYNLVFLHTADLIEAGDTVNFGFIVAIGDTPSEARTAYEAAIELCYDLDEDGFENELGAGDDCDDTDSSVNPDEEEIWYDGWDQDCGQDDDYDADGDGYVPDEYVGSRTYDPGTGDRISGSGTAPGGDCDDSDADVNPGEDETWYDGLDSDCAEDDDYDADGDGFVPDEYEGLATYDASGAEVSGTGDLPGNDCDDTDADVNPDAEEIWYDGYDQDCSGDDDYDADGDGYAADGYDGLPTYDPGSGDAIEGTGELPGGDCADEDYDINPGAEEVWYDGLDSDCAEDDDYDADGDGYVPDEYEGLPTYDAGGDVVEGTGTGTAGDCDDNNADTNPEADEIWYDGLDEDCDGGDDYDADGDGYVPEEYEGLPTYDGDGEAIPGTGDLPSDDCDDDNANTNPESEDTWYDGVDSDCGEDDDYDADGDGYVPDEYEGLPTYDPGTGDEIDGTGEAPGGDCDDHDPDIGPGVEETWYDGVDSDCGEDDDYDADGDGYAAEGYDGLPTYDASGDEIEGTGDLPGDDCNDADADINPGATEIWYDGVDQDCDDNDNDADGDGHGHEGFGGDDCDDTDVSIWATEDCGTEGFYKGGGGATCATAVSRGSWWLGALALLGLARRRRR